MPEASHEEQFRGLRAVGVRHLAERVEEVAAAWAELVSVPEWQELERAQANATAAIVHKIAGSGGTFGFPDVSRAASSLEILLGAISSADVATPESRDQVGQLVKAMKIALQDVGQSRASPSLATVHDHDGAHADEAPVVAVALADRIGEFSGSLSQLGFLVAPQAAITGEVPLGVPPASVAVLDDVDGSAWSWVSAFAGRAPMIVIADDVDLDFRLRAARAGIDVVLSRPVDMSELADWLNSLAFPGGEQPFRVLIVDDDPLLTEIYAAALERSGMIASTVNDPSLALGMISASFPDLVLMDVQMPAMSGIELARVIRQSRRFLSLPIVFLSAEQDATKQMLARRFGGDDFISKPVDLDRLVEIVRIRAERARALRTAMEHDSLTGLLNHGRFKDRLQHDLERNRRTHAELSLVIIDVDQFKSVNDTYGHLVGDQVLRNLGRTLRARLRKIEHIGRYGGEEFGVIFLDTPAVEAAAVMDTVRQSFGLQRFEAGEARFSVSFSAGVASSRDFPEMKSLIEAADAALYVAKRGGRNCVEIAPSSA